MQFASPVYGEWDLKPYEFDTLQTMDVDRDGDKDILFTRSNHDFWQLSWSENDGDQFLEPALLHKFAEPGIESDEGRRPFLYDVNRDGHEDFVSTDFRGKLTWFPDVRESQQIQSESPSFHHTAIVDVDGDNDLEWVGSDTPGNNVIWFEGIGQDFSPQVITATDLRHPLYPIAADIDADGDEDIIVVHATDTLQWYENKGSGEFANVATLLQLPTSHNFVQVVEINGDNRPDILLRYQDGSASRVTVYHPNLIDGFGKPIILPSRRFIDSDGDGDLDVVSSDRSQFLLNDGTGIFNETMRLPSWSWQELVAGDTDGDGDQDFIKSTSNHDELILHKNMGDGTYTSQQLATPRPRPGGQTVRYADFQLVDLDGDEDLDLALLYEARSEQLELFENRAGTFSLVDSRTLSDFPVQPLQFTDLDGDQDLDIMVLAVDTPIYIENLGSMQFQPVRNLERYSSWQIAVADFNDDGAPDVIGTVGIDHRLHVYWNERNRDITPTDIDLLYAKIDDESSDDELDWNRDRKVNVADVDFLLDVVGTIRGDTDLDGDIDFKDFLAATRSFGETNAGWAGGDFDGNGTVEFADLLVIFANFGFDSGNEDPA